MNFQNFFSFLIQLPVYVFWFIVVMIPLVVAHEFGHFLIARAFKVKVPEFGVGVPPRAFGVRWKGVLWSLNWIPLGAFVRIVGDNDSTESAFNKRNAALAKYSKMPAAKEELTTALAEVRKFYIEERRDEVLALGDVVNLLEANNVTYDATWKSFIKNYRKVDYQNTSDFKEKIKIIETFVGWEYDSYFDSKNKKEFNSLFFTKNIIQKILILVGGVSANMIMAFLIFLLALNTTGLIANNTFESDSLIDGKYLTNGKVDMNGNKNFLDRGLVFALDTSDPEIAKLSPDEKKKAFEAIKADYKTNIEELSSVEFLKGKGNLKSIKSISTLPTSTTDKTISLRFTEGSGVDNERLDSFIKEAKEMVSKDSTSYSPKFVVSLVEVSNDGKKVAGSEKIIISKYDLLKNASIVNKATYKSENFIKSFGDATDHTRYYTELTFKATSQFFVRLFSKDVGQAASELSGPVAISYISKNSFDAGGLTYILWIMALISISLAIMNMLPIPALDGGRIVLVILHRIFGDRVKKIEPILVNITYIFLLLVMFGVMFKDAFTIAGINNIKFW